MSTRRPYCPKCHGSSWLFRSKHYGPNARKCKACGHTANASQFLTKNLMTTYDIVHLADNEWDTEIMQRVAVEWFKAHPACQFVEVHEHAGWFLGYRRDMTIWSTANDGARCPGTRPEQFSGLCERRADFNFAVA